MREVGTRISPCGSGDHGDQTLTAAAKAMRHCARFSPLSIRHPLLISPTPLSIAPAASKMAESAHYDKNGSDRLVARAVAAADQFAKSIR